MFAIFKREFKSYFQTVIGWIYLAAIIGIFGLYYFANNLSYGAPQISYSISGLTFIFLIPVSILTMRSLSEEQRTKTDQLILTAPVSVGKIVAAKYLAMAAINTIAVLIMFVAAAVLQIFGTTPMAENFVCIFGFWLYGMACIAIGLFVSSLTESQVISAVLTFAFLFIGYMMSGITGLISATGNLMTQILGSYDLQTPLSNFTDGCFSVTGLIYYVTISILFLFLATQVIQKRRWDITSKKIKMGVFSSGFVIVGIVLAIVVNLVANQLPGNIASIDVTSQKLYSITDETKEYLASIDKDITIYAIAAKGDLDATVEETLERMEDETGHIKVEYKNPATNPNFYQQYSDSVVGQGSLIIVCGEVSRVVAYSDLFESTIDYSTYQSTTTGYDGEGQIVSALQYVTSENLPCVYEIAGHGEASLGSGFTTALEKANITSTSINLMDADTVPEDAQAVIINGPTSDYSKDDAEKVIDYINAGGNVLITLNSDAIATEMPNFEQILSAVGTSAVKGIVAEGDNQKYYQSPFYILPDIASSSYTASTGGNYIFVPYTQAIEHDADSDEVTYTELLTTSSDAVSKSDVANATSYGMEEGDAAGPFALAVAVEKSIDDETTSHAVIVGSSMLFTDDADQMVSGNNANLFTDIMSQFVNTDDVETLVIPVKAFNASQLTIAAATQIVMGLCGVILLPVVLLILGIVIWIRRRKR